MTETADSSSHFLRIEASGRLLALIVRTGRSPEKTTFLTEQNLPFQAGFIVYSKGGEVAAHDHKPLHRELATTSEALIVREGSCLLDIFDPDRKLLGTYRLGEGDLVVLYAGGHGIRMPDERCVLFEIKQGPYTGIDEKERFNL